MDIELYKCRGGLPLRNRGRFERMLKAAQKVCGLDGFTGILQIVLLPKEPMAEMNWAHLKHEGATDVLTFDLRGENTAADELAADGELPVVAEIYVCPEVAVDYAQAHGLDCSRELALYAIHGMLHLTGQDDIEDADRLEMRRKEAKAMAALEAMGFSFDGFLDKMN